MFVKVDPRSHNEVMPAYRQPGIEQRERDYMNKSLYIGAICASVALCQSSRASYLEISLDPSTHTPADVKFNDITGNPDSVLGWLQGEVMSWNNFVNTPHLPDPTTNLTKYEDLTVAPTIAVEAGDYLAVHYGVGNGGIPGSGGGLEALYFDTAQSVTLPNNGTGPFGFGGISFIYLYDHTSTVPPEGTLPDGGMTLTLLAGGVSLLGGISRFRKPAAR